MQRHWEGWLPLVCVLDKDNHINAYIVARNSESLRFSSWILRSAFFLFESQKDQLESEWIFLMSMNRDSRSRKQEKRLDGIECQLLEMSWIRSCQYADECFCGTEKRGKERLLVSNSRMCFAIFLYGPFFPALWCFVWCFSCFLCCCFHLVLIVNAGESKIHPWGHFQNNAIFPSLSF